MTKKHLNRVIKERRGLHPGKPSFGYSRALRRKPDGRAYVETTVNESEAQVVLSIFERYGAGATVRAIAADLNKQSGARRWSPSSIGATLSNQGYRGMFAWRRRTGAPAAKNSMGWLVIERPDLRIVPDELWFRVQARAAATRT